MNEFYDWLKLNNFLSATTNMRFAEANTTKNVNFHGASQQINKRIVTIGSVSNKKKKLVN